MNADNLAEFKELISVFADVFEMEPFSMPPNAHLQTLLEQEGFIAFVAVSGGRIVGGLTTYLLQAILQHVAARVCL